MPVCCVNKVNIHYYAAGDEVKKERSVLFIHGAGSTGKRWFKQLEALGDNYFAIAIDLPGHLPSEGSCCDQVFLYREWIKEFVDAMGLVNPILAGHSMGGAIAMDYALKYPDETVGLILVATAANFDVNRERLQALGRGEYEAEWARQGMAPSAPKDMVDRFIEESMRLDRHTRYVDMLAVDRFEEKGIHNIKCPSLIICGTKDVGTPPPLSEKLARRIKNSELILVEEAAHYVMMEKPEEVNCAIMEFLKQL